MLQRNRPVTVGVSTAETAPGQQSQLNMAYTPNAGMVVRPWKMGWDIQNKWCGRK